MADGISRHASSGQVDARKGAIAVPQTAVGGSATASATVAFAGARVGDVVSISPRATLQGASGIWQAMVLATDVITIVFGTGGAALTITAQTMDATVEQY